MIGIPPHLSTPETDRLQEHSEQMGVTVSCVRRGKVWRIRVRKDQRVTELRGEGPLAAVVAGALDDFEALYPSEAWTEAEIIQVANQTPGMEIQRA